MSRPWARQASRIVVALGDAMTGVAVDRELDAARSARAARRDARAWRRVDDDLGERLRGIVAAETRASTPGRGPARCRGCHRSHSATSSGCRRADSIADDAVWPRPQIDASRIAWPISRSSASSCVTASHAAARPRAGAAPPPGGPCRRGTARTGRTTRRGRTRRCGGACPTRSAVSSKTMTTPDPSVAPIARVPSKVSGTSSSSGPTKAPAAPPSSTAWSAGRRARRPPAPMRSPQRRPERHLVQARPRDVARTGRTASGPVDPSVPIAAKRGAAVAQDQRHVGERLDVVDGGRLAEQAVRRPGRAACCAVRRGRPRSTRRAPSPRRDVGARRRGGSRPRTTSRNPRMLCRAGRRRGPHRSPARMRVPRRGYSARM